MEIDGGFGGLLVVALTFSIINVFIGTILRLLTIPLKFITLGLIALVVNAVLLAITVWWSTGSRSTTSSPPSSPQCSSARSAHSCSASSCGPSRSNLARRHRTTRRSSNGFKHVGPAHTMGGWIAFGAIFMFINGLFGFIVGLVALFKDDFFVVTEDRLVTFDITTWGWINIVFSVLLMVLAAALAAGKRWALVHLGGAGRTAHGRPVRISERHPGVVGGLHRRGCGRHLGHHRPRR